MSEPTNSKTIRESFAQLYEDYTTGIRSFNPAVLWITGYELRIVDKTSKVSTMKLNIELEPEGCCWCVEYSFLTPSIISAGVLNKHICW